MYLIQFLYRKEVFYVFAYRYRPQYQFSGQPYFGFLALLAQHQPPQIAALALILLYNFIYLLPLMLVYWGYQALSGSALLQKLEQIMGRIAAYLVPVLLLLLGGWLCWYSLSLGQWTVV